MNIGARLRIGRKPSKQRCPDGAARSPFRRVGGVVSGTARVVVGTDPQKRTLRRRMHQLELGFVEIAEIRSRELLEGRSGLFDLALSNSGPRAGAWTYLLF